MQPIRLVLFFLIISVKAMFSSSFRVIDDDRRCDESSVEEAADDQITKTILVDWAGYGDFRSVQQAIDSVPINNNQWIHIHVSRGIYWEKIVIRENKPFTFLEGEGAQGTIISWADANNTKQSVTFEVQADNFVAKQIVFKNTYNHPSTIFVDGMKQAVAAMVSGDKNSFYNCSFLSVQDTLWDSQGRHFFTGCYIEGAVDFIFGAGQSIYKACTLKVTADPNVGVGGYITAQGRERASDPNGFVFEYCNVIGTGRVYLGRAWRAASRVLFYKTILDNDVVPAGWDAREYAGNEGNIVFAEVGCTGKGSDMSERVKWEKKLSEGELIQLLSLSYINSDGWIERQP